MSYFSCIVLTYVSFILSGVYIFGWAFFIWLGRSGTGGTHFVSGESLKPYIATGVVKHY